MRELNHLEKLQVDQIEEASRVLGRAFQNDPLFVYFYPNTLERKTKSVIYCEWVILNGILSMEVYVTSKEIEGIVVWRPYKIKDQKKETPFKELKKRMRVKRKELFSDQLFYERNSVFSEVILSPFENQHANFPHWEPWIIGVDPKQQGKGFGTKLLRMKLTEIDEQNLPCYLHTENEGNIKFYEHFGFEVVGHASIPNSKLKSWAMIRKKRKAI